MTKKRYLLCLFISLVYLFIGTSQADAASCYCQEMGTKSIKNGEIFETEGKTSCQSGYSDCNKLKEDEGYKSCVFYSSTDCTKAQTTNCGTKTCVAETEFCHQTSKTCLTKVGSCNSQEDCLKLGGNVPNYAICNNKICYLGGDALKKSQETSATTMKVLQEIKPPTTSIRIPGLTFSDVKDNIKQEGADTYIYFPWIGEYLVIVYKFLVAVTSIVAVVIIILQGAKIVVSAGGQAKTEAYKKIGQVLIGACIAWGSYAILYNINPDIVTFKALKVKYIVGQEIDSMAGSDPNDASIPDILLPEASGDNSYAKLKSVCQKNGSLATLKAILPTWESIGTNGGAIYVRGGVTTANGCSAGAPQDDWLKKYYSKNGISYNPSATTAELRNMYNTKILPNFKGKLCGDCGTWSKQLFQCAGLPDGFNWRKLNENKKCNPPYCIAQSSGKQSCKEVASTIPGGVKFGDVFFFYKQQLNFYHWFVYTGNAGLSFEAIEMGGGSPNPKDRCGKVPGGTGYNNCVRSHKKADDYYGWAKTSDFCYIYRIYKN